MHPFQPQSERDDICGAIRTLLRHIDPDPDRPGLVETPERVYRSYAELFAGYAQDPKDILKTFDEEYSDEMVLLRGVEFFSCCEHHLLPFSGTANIAYIPADKKVVGLSKLARLLDVYARRLQIQERLTCQVTTALDSHLSTKGSACVISASHFCMVCRGVNKQHSRMVTASLTGNFRSDPTVRREFYNLIGVS